MSDSFKCVKHFLKLSPFLLHINVVKKYKELSPIYFDIRNFNVPLEVFGEHKTHKSRIFSRESALL